MKKYVWLTIVGVGVLCIAIFYYVFVYRLTCDLNGWTLTISGKEKMTDYGYFNDKIAPWNYKHPHIKDFFTAEVHNVIIKEGVTRIGNYAFKNCPYLEHVTIPSSVTEIGDSAFYDCINLNSVDITDLEAWCKIDFGNYYANPLSQALHFCLSGKEVNDLVIPDGVTKIGAYAFAGYSGITSVTIPSSVEKIGYGAFKGCSGLTSITIPSSVKYIGDYAFAGCFGLTSITIPSSVKEIRTCAFVGCTGLTSVHITDLLSWCRIDFDTFFSDSYSDEYKGEYANPLYNAKHLYLNGKEIHDLVIPNGTTEIKRHAFEGCSGLKSVTIPASVKKIGHGAFSGCSSLKSITIPKSVKVIRTGAFQNCI